eukprot:6817289-Prymnesium_polylepis.1
MQQGWRRSTRPQPRSLLQALRLEAPALPPNPAWARVEAPVKNRGQARLRAVNPPLLKDCCRGLAPVKQGGPARGQAPLVHAAR